MAISRSPAQRAYLRRLAILMIAYLTLVFTAGFGEREGWFALEALAVLAVATGLCIAGVFWALGRLLVEETDEFVRMLIVRQALIATGLSLSLCSIYGFLTAYGLAPPIDLYWAAILWFFGLGAGAIVNRLQYGAWGQCA